MMKMFDEFSAVIKVKMSKKVKNHYSAVAKAVFYIDFINPGTVFVNPHGVSSNKV